VATDGFVPPGTDEASPERVRRIVKETSLYETAIGLYPVLLGLILTDSLKDMAVDIVHHPLAGGDWSARLLTLALLEFSALWLHIWVATFRSMSVTGATDGVHDRYPGHRMRSTAGYGAALIVFWLGVVQLILFACMSYSVDRQKEFFVESAIYSLVLFIYGFIDARSSSIEDEQVRRKVWQNPWWSVMSLWRGRHLPISKEHLERQVDGSSQDLQILQAQGRIYDLIWAFVLIGLSLLLYLLSSQFNSAWWVALVAFAGTTTAAVTDYYVYPYFYLL
jgi:hypothetical protein